MSRSIPAPIHSRVARSLRIEREQEQQGEHEHHDGGQDHRRQRQAIESGMESGSRRRARGGMRSGPRGDRSPSRATAIPKMAVVPPCRHRQCQDHGLPREVSGAVPNARR